MDNYITGKTIKNHREKKNITQLELANILGVSDKTISKWETSRGLPDISLIEPLSKALNISIVELITGDFITNKNKSCNIKKSKIYVCPICGNIIHSIGEATILCCGINLPELEAEIEDNLHTIQYKKIENEYYISINHDMHKNHYISFIAYVTLNSFELVKLYPEQNPETNFLIKGHGIIYIYCNKHGLIKKTI